MRREFDLGFDVAASAATKGSRSADSLPPPPPAVSRRPSSDGCRPQSQHVEGGPSAGSPAAIVRRPVRAWKWTVCVSPSLGGDAPAKRREQRAGGGVRGCGSGFLPALPFSSHRPGQPRLPPSLPIFPHTLPDRQLRALCAGSSSSSSPRFQQDDSRAAAAAVARRFLAPAGG
ncbi:Hypothetical predicted protein [Podarcis lilfordi]|uniref:Uncharacterized protein n=1 Tax=Podarcis lilfordi TaxID=74358 RepID=A0AA35PML0_9SAUR|nr:Hypothetical predicted protein [Podarcis lilfordi]